MSRWIGNLLGVLVVGALVIGAVYAAPAMAVTYTCFDPTMQIPLHMVAACAGAF